MGPGRGVAVAGVGRAAHVLPRLQGARDLRHGAPQPRAQGLQGRRRHQGMYTRTLMIRPSPSITVFICKKDISASPRAEATDHRTKYAPWRRRRSSPSVRPTLSLGLSLLVDGIDYGIDLDTHQNPTLIHNGGSMALQSPSCLTTTFSFSPPHLPSKATPTSSLPSHRFSLFSTVSREVGLQST